MRNFSIFLTVILFAISSNVSADSLWDISTSKNWKMLQDGEIVQWAVVVPDVAPRTRIDFVSQAKSGVRDNFFTVRTECPSGKVVITVVRIGAIAGLGNNCDGQVGVNQVKWLFDKVDPLPEKAMKP